MTFKCRKCGECCSHLRSSIYSLKVFSDDLTFHYTFDKTGKCEKLIDNKCSVFETRPALCNTETVRIILKIKKKKYNELCLATCKKIKSLP